MKKKFLSIISIFLILSMVIPQGFSYASEDVLEEESNETEEESEEEVSEEPSEISEDAQEPLAPIESDSPVNSPAFYEEKDVNGITISVEGSDGVIPLGTELVVKEVEADSISDDAAVSYAFDISLMNGGEEIQPNGEVKVSFTLKEVSNSNLETTVYHEGEELDVVEDGDTATVITDGFSIYTVEFTYKGKEYVLEGGSAIKLTDLLSYVGLSGEVTSYSVSNPELFDIFNGFDSELKYEVIVDEESNETLVPINSASGDTLYLVSLKPFSTEEWLRVVIDDIEYEIRVTDDYVNYSGSQEISSDKVVQGGNENNFTKDMPIATIFIDENVVNMNKASRDAAVPTLLVDTTEHPGFVWFNPTGYSGDAAPWSRYLAFSMNKEDLNYGASGNDTYFDGPIVQYDFNDGAAIIDPVSGERTNYKVRITYSNLHITLQDNLTDDEYDLMANSAVPNNAYLGLFEGNMVGLGEGGQWASSKGPKTLTANGHGRYGIKVDVKIQILDDNDSPVDGTFYYPMVDLDVNRDTSDSTNTFAKLYDSENNRNYSEQVIIKDGLASPLYIPGGDYDSSASVDTNNNMPYLSGITETSDGINIYPVTSYSLVSNSRDNDFYTGFATLVDNSKGLSLTYMGSSPENRSGVVTYLLSGTSHINHLLVSSTGEGGAIQTTRNGNHDGTLSDGSELFGPSTLTVATGQTVRYTMTPNPGYRIKSVTVANGSTTYSNGSTVTPTSVDTDSDGITDYYYFEFEDIDSNNAIHVEWEPDVYDLTISKTTVDDEEGTFEFVVKIYSDAQKTDLWKEETLSISNGNSETISDIPNGYYYEITESRKSGWQVNTTNPSNGRILNNNVSIDYENEKLDAQTGSLTVTKETNIDTDEEFEFKVRIWKENKYTYIITEADVEYAKANIGYVEFYDEKIHEIVQAITNQTPNAIVQIDGVSVVYNDGIIEPPNLATSGGPCFIWLSSGHTVQIGYESYLYDKETFAPYLDNLVGKKIEAYYSDDLYTYLNPNNYSDSQFMDNGDATYSIKLKNGETFTLDNIPDGYEYSIEEVNIPDGWELKSTTGDTSGTISSGDDKNITFSNEYTLREITLKKIWDDENDKYSLRPFDLEGFITYIENVEPDPNNPVEPTPVTVNTEANGWVKSGNEWIYTFTIPKNVTVTDWGEVTVPTAYNFTKGNADVDSDVYLMTNTLKTFDLTVSKTVTGNMGDKSKAFKFTVKIGDENILLFQNEGEYTATWDRQEPIIDGYNALKPGDKILVTATKVSDVNGPIYGHYTFEDWSYVGTLNEYLVMDIELYGDEGLGIGFPDLEHGNINIYPNNGDGPILENLHIIKLAEHPVLDLTEYDERFTDNGDGTHTIKLSHGGSFTIDNIPYGYKYEVVESDYSSEGYETTVNGSSGRTASGEITEDTNVSYVNNYNTLVPTRARTTGGLEWVLIALIVLVGIDIIVSKKEKGASIK